MMKSLSLTYFSQHCLVKLADAGVKLGCKLYLLLIVVDGVDYYSQSVCTKQNNEQINTNRVEAVNVTLLAAAHLQRTIYYLVE